MVARCIIGGLLLATGCAAEGFEARRDSPADVSNGTPGAELPTSSEPDAAAPGDADVEAPPVLSWSFEPASADCNGWPVVGADAIRASPARSGAYSCKVCSNGSAAPLGLMRDLGAVPSGRYTLTAWVRSRAESDAPDEAVARVEAARSSGDAVTAVAPSVAVRDAWDRLEATIDLEGGASSVRLTIGATSPEADRCLFIDDVTFDRAR